MQNTVEKPEQILSVIFSLGLRLFRHVCDKLFCWLSN